MPTITTTVTSAAACGTTTTCTTTEASPDAAHDHPLIAKTLDLLGRWGAGEFQTVAGVAKVCHPQGTIEFANQAVYTNTDIFRTYHGCAGISEWCINTAQIDYGALNWSWSVDADTSVVYGTVAPQKWGCHATGRYTEVAEATIKFQWKDDLCFQVLHYWPVSLNNCFGDDTVQQSQDLLAAWGEGAFSTLQGCEKWATADAKWEFANAKYFTRTSIIKDYNGPAELLEWCGPSGNQLIDFGDMKWTWAYDHAAGCAVGTVAGHKLGVHATGRHTSEQDAVVKFWWKDGKCSRVLHYFPLELNDCF